MLRVSESSTKGTQIQDPWARERSGVYSGFEGALAQLRCWQEAPLRKASFRPSWAPKTGGRDSPMLLDTNNPGCAERVMLRRQGPRGRRGWGMGRRHQARGGGSKETCTVPVVLVTPGSGEVI